VTVLAAELAPAKINLCLFLGPTRADGRHELVTLFDSIGLADELEVVGADRDEVVCEGVAGPNLVADALAALRAAGWDAPPVRVRIHKRIPVAAGMGGGSADAAAMLRLAPRLAPVAVPVLARIAARLGADVPAQLHPGPSLGTGAGDVVAAVSPLPPYGVLVLPQPFALSTADVYGEADRLGLARPAAELAARRSELAAALPAVVPPELIVNDLARAALSLRPQIAAALDRARDAGADQAIVCGSGPTSIGIFWGADGGDRARDAATRLASAHPGAGAAIPVVKGVRAPMPNE
jgi:4-diphosphocytidyl-2-C-methyl-D-erythritol kinase